MTRPKVAADKRIRTAQACETCKRRKQKVRLFVLVELLLTSHCPLHRSLHLFSVHARYERRNYSCGTVKTCGRLLKTRSFIVMSLATWMQKSRSDQHSYRRPVVSLCSMVSATYTSWTLLP